MSSLFRKSTTEDLKVAIEKCVHNGSVKSLHRSVTPVEKGNLGSSPESASVLPSPSLAPDPAPSASPTSPTSPSESSKSVRDRRRSMTVPVNTFYPSTTDSSSTTTTTTKPALSSPQEETLPPRSLTPQQHQTLPTTKKSNRFVVSKITEDTVREGGALIMPSRSSASSSVTGSPETSRARSPLVVLLPDEKMVSPTGESPVTPFRPPLLTSMSLSSPAESRRGSLTRKISREKNDALPSPSTSVPEHEPFVFLGVCAMAKKAKSKYMVEILTRITQEFEQIKTVVFDEQQILNDPVEKWPIVDALISFTSDRFPLQKAIQYWRFRKPLLINDLEMQYVIKDRRKVYELLKSIDIELPRYAVLDRDSGKEEDAQLEEAEDFIIVNGTVFNKPFVEKPVCADDHNIYIYYPMSAGGGSQRLFRKIQNRSSMYSKESKVRRTGSFIYEEFMPTDGTDVKVYTVGPEYAHAEARKSPALDGRVERDIDGKEIRFPVILNNIEKLIARRICDTFKQMVCGFDLLRANGRSYVCDVNGFSFVKNSMIYYNDCAKIIANHALRKLAPELHIPWARPYQLEDPPIVTTTQGKMMELRCVVAVMRHGDRTPKQKMKMEVSHPAFFAIYTSYGGRLDAEGREIKLKKPKQLQEILDVTRDMLASHLDEPEIKDKRLKLEQLKSVLEMYGHFSGINRKIQMKYHPAEKADGEATQGDKNQNADENPKGALVLIMKWGGELTPLGKYQSEQLGQMFRCMYPGSGESSDKQGHGLLRLHSTLRHDLKIYASDEGRVQTTAAAFAKGLLALEGELTPILVQMVKSADTNGLLDNDLDARESGNIVKKRLKSILKKNADFSEEDIEALNPTDDISVKAAIAEIKNPVAACEEMHRSIGELVTIIREKARSQESELPALYTGESWDLIDRRWGKLEKDFRLRDGQFDITKIPDIYDCIRFDRQHNHWMNKLTCVKNIFKIAQNLANIVVPLEYGITQKEKLTIAQGIASPLLRKIRTDLQHVLDTPCEKENDPENVNRLHPRFSQNIASPDRLVRTRLYFTSESHIHSLMNIFRFGGLVPENDEQWKRAMTFVSAVPEFNFLTQIVIMQYEDPTKPVDSEERFHIELHFSPGMQIKDSETNPVKAKIESDLLKPAPDKLSKNASGDGINMKISTATLKNDSQLSIVGPLPSSGHRKSTVMPATSMSHLAEGWLDNLDSNSTINFPKTRYDRSIFKPNAPGVVMNRVFSTNVIKGISSGSSLDKMDDSTEATDVKCLSVPNVTPLETLHNALSLKQLDDFIKAITAPASKQVTPARTPDVSATGNEVDARKPNPLQFVHQYSSGSTWNDSEISSPQTTPSAAGGPNFVFRPLTADASLSQLDKPDAFSALDEHDQPMDVEMPDTSSSPQIDSLIFSPVKPDRRWNEEDKERKQDASSPPTTVSRQLDFDMHDGTKS
ncbi:hypothetical protein RvY_10649 [Ramazzottius varieornatus]|uniref:Inositol hexakisphosphate and diphosphoinositol-pentakisphosphate kinase n=1 Tax=Ramazzottius varieornatus TaxID=947166 RepID=A0A1D1VMG7_RAMVA|nr:hypothetical protein RvY_10649 [Ramazzottius varieornatus]